MTNTNTTPEFSLTEKLLAVHLLVWYAVILYFQHFVYSWTEGKIMLFIGTPGFFVMVILVGILITKTWVQRLFILPVSLVVTFLWLLSLAYGR
jgi:hypothetical protein